MFPIALLAVMLFSSCSKDDEEEILPESYNPVVTVYLDGTNTPITQINDKGVGETVPVRVVFEMGEEGAKLTDIKIVTELQGQTFTVLDSSLNSGWLNSADKRFERKYNIAVGQSLSKITFSTVDKKSRVGSLTLTVAPKGTNIPSKIRTAVLLAGQMNTSSDHGGFYSFSLDQDFKLADAVTNAPYIDMVYFYGVQNGASLATMSDPILGNQEKGPAGIKNVIGQFEVLNATKFAYLTSNAFETGTAAVLPSDSDFSEKLLNHLSVGDCFAFKTVLGDKGFMKVMRIDGTDEANGADRTITLSIKVL